MSEGRISRLTSCIKCELFRSRTLIVSGNGPIPSELMFIGEAPGRKEDAQGAPFIGAAGIELDKLFKDVGIDRSKVVITNVVKCLPLDATGSIRTPSKEEVAACREHLERDVRECQPRVIVTLGASAFKGLTGSGKAITKARGIPLKMEIGGVKVTVLPTFHPAAILHAHGGKGESIKNDIRADLRHALMILDPSSQPQGDYQLIDSGIEFLHWMEKARDWDCFAFDIETRGLSITDPQIIGISFSGERATGQYIPLQVWSPKREEFIRIWGDQEHLVLKDLKSLLESKTRKAAHHGKFDVARLKMGWGIEVQNWSFDTMLAAHLLNENLRDYGLASLTGSRYPDLAGYKAEVKKAIGVAEAVDAGEGLDYGEQFARLPLETIWNYGARDADATFRLACDLGEELQEANLIEFFTRFSMPVAHTLAEMEINGMGFDAEYCANLTSELTRESESILNEIRSKAGKPELNVRSTKQLKQLFIDERHLRIVKKTPKGNVSTDASVLEAWAQDGDDIAQRIVDYRQVATCLSTFLLPIPQLVQSDGRIHTNLHQHRTVSGRLSSSDPNLQNIPAHSELGKRVRGIYVPAPGNVLIGADYAQIELRVLAWRCQDEILLNAFRNNLDPHVATARQVFDIPESEEVDEEVRYQAKTLNFSILYGAEAPNVAEQLKISKEKAQALINQWFKGFPKVKEWIDWVHREARDKGYLIGPFGRVRRFPELFGEPIGGRFDPIIAHARRQAVNSIIQGAASDFTCFNMARLARCLGGPEKNLGAKVVLQIHDAVYLECPEDKKDQVVELMRMILLHTVDPIDVPMKVDIEVVKRWGEEIGE